MSIPLICDGRHNTSILTYKYTLLNLNRG